MATSLEIDDELKSRIQHLAAARDRSANWVMREAIKQYVDREEGRERFRQEALDAWTAYRETGRHLTGDEVADWLNGWGTADEIGMPDCHV